jgi:hypothetical protein
MSGLQTDLRFQRIFANISNIFPMFPTSLVVIYDHFLLLLLDLLLHLSCFLHRTLINPESPSHSRVLFLDLRGLSRFLDNPPTWKLTPLSNFLLRTFPILNPSYLLKCNPTTLR